MRVKYEGKSPNQAWYALQYTKALAQTPFQDDCKTDAKDAGKNAAISAGVLTATQFVTSYLFFLPLIPTLGLLGGLGVGGYYAVQAFHNFRDLKDSKFVENYISEREENWLEKKSGPKLVARIKNAISTKLKQAASLFTRLGSVAGYAIAAVGVTAAAVGGLQLAGVSVIPAAALTSVLSVISLPVAVGIAAAAIPLGAGIGFGCHVLTRKLVGKTQAAAPDQTTAAPAAATASVSSASLGLDNAPSAAVDFSVSASPPVATAAPAQLSPERQAAAAARLARRKNGA